MEYINLDCDAYLFRPAGVFHETKFGWASVQEEMPLEGGRNVEDNGIDETIRSWS